MISKFSGRRSRRRRKNLQPLILAFSTIMHQFSVCSNNPTPPQWLEGSLCLIIYQPMWMFKIMGGTGLCCGTIEYIQVYGVVLLNLYRSMMWYY